MMLCYSLVKSFNYSVESTTAVRQKRSESGKAFEINYLHHRSIVNRACLIIFFSLRVFHVSRVARFGWFWCFRWGFHIISNFARFPKCFYYNDIVYEMRHFACFLILPKMKYLETHNTLFSFYTSVTSTFCAGTRIYVFWISQIARFRWDFPERSKTKTIRG